MAEGGPHPRPFASLRATRPAGLPTVGDFVAALLD